MWKKNLLLMFLGLTGLMGLSCGRKEIPIIPLIQIPPEIRAWPIPAVLIIRPDTEHFHFWSPDRIPAGPIPNHNSVRPFTLPVGRAFAGAAYDAFGRIFPELSVKNQPTAADGARLVIETALEDFSLEMAYVSFGPSPHETFLDIKGRIKARFRFNRPGKDPWEKRVVSEIPSTRLLVNPWTEEEIGKLVAVGLAALYEKILREAVAIPENPFPPLVIWLTE